jgi:hypothetical protein
MTAVAEELDTTSIEDLDFDEDIPCEMTGAHLIYGDGPASWVICVRSVFPCGCRNAPSAFACNGCREITLTADYIMCSKCMTKFRPSQIIVRITPIKG